MSSHIILDSARHSGEEENGIFVDHGGPESALSGHFRSSFLTAAFAQSASFDEPRSAEDDRPACLGRHRDGCPSRPSVASDAARPGERREICGFPGRGFPAEVRTLPDPDDVDRFAKTDNERSRGRHRHGNGASGDKQNAGMTQPGSTPEGASSDKRRSDECPEKQSQIYVTLKWLTDNYERAEGVCLPRCVLYSHYLDFCKRHNFTPAGAATFGKLIRQRFPKLTTRRLGTRGQSKYHYYGIGIKETSAYYHAVYSGKGLTRFSGTKVKTEGSSRKFSLSAKTGTLLPDFPDVNDVILPASLDKDKLQTFVLMYRTHCQRILDTVISTNFDEVHNFLLHFWQGMPEHLVPLLSHDVIGDIVSSCDTTLYRVLLDVLIPSTVQELPESLCSQVKGFVSKLPTWITRSLEGVPETIVTRKQETVTIFVRCLRRQISFIHLAQTARSLLTNAELVAEMVRDLDKVDFRKICQEACCTDPSSNAGLITQATDHFNKLKSLLRKQASIETITEWMDDVIDSCVIQVSKETNRQSQAAKFVLRWTIFESLIVRDLTLDNVTTYGSIHLIHIMLDEYIFLVMDTYNQQLKERQVQAAVRKHLKNSGSALDINKKPDRSKSTDCLSTNKKRKRIEVNINERKFSEPVLIDDGKLKLQEEKDIKQTKLHQEPDPPGFNRSYLPLPKYPQPPDPSSFCGDRECAGRPGHSTVLSPILPQPVPHMSAALDHRYASQFGHPNPDRHPGVVYDVQIQNPAPAGYAPRGDPLTASAFNIVGPPGSAPYWSGGYPEGYSAYCCHRRYLGNYDGHNCSMTLLRMNPEACPRVATFDPTAPPQYDHVTASGLDHVSYYGATQDSYSNTRSNYSQFAHCQAGLGQYGSQDTLCSSQYDIYSHGLTSFGHSITKSVVSPFH